MLEVIFYFWNNNKYNEDQDEWGEVIDGVWYEVAMVTDRRIEQMAQLFRDD